MYKGKYSQPRTPVMEQDVIPEQEITEESIIAEVHAREEEERVKKTAPGKPVKKEKKKASRGTKIFYIIYAVLVVLLLAAAVVAMFLLRNFLIEFQASQPEEKSREVYAQTFENPDWVALYELADIEDTTFEGVDAFAAYMTEQTAGKTLSFLETASGLSEDHKYIVRADNDKVASFTLVNTVTDSDALPVWELGDVELYYERTESVTVEKDPDYTVLINGKSLDDSYTVIKEFTAAEEYLSEGVHSYRKDTQFVDGLLVAPEVTCVDQNGVQVDLEKGEDGIYRPNVQTETEEATKEQIDRAVGASKVYAEYMVQRAGRYELQEYYDSQSKTYKDMVGVDLFTRPFDSYYFDEENMVVSEYHRYSETLYSIRVNLPFKVNLTTGSVKEFPSDRTYFLETKSNGKILVVATTNAAIHDVKRQVRLDFSYDGKVESVFVDAASKSVELPYVEVPAGQVLTGWAQKTVDENGKNVLVMVITPGAAGFGVVSGELEPMVLYPMFEKEGTA